MTRPPQNRVITACAGSGKTYALIERLLFLLQNGAKASEIVAITFTKKAAAEIRERLLAALTERAAKEAWARRCLRRIMLAETADDVINIHTFHGWFGLLLSGRMWSRGWYGPPRLLESDADLRRAAWRRWLAAADDDENLRAVLAHCSPATLRGLLFGFIGKINAWRMYQQFAGEAAAEEMPDAAAARTRLTAALERFAAKARGGKSGDKAAAAAAAFIAGEAQTLPGIYTAAETLNKLLIKDAEKRGYAPQLDAVAAAYDDWRDAADTAAAMKFNAAMSALAAGFFRIYERLKHEANVMTFDDMEYEAYLLLQKDGDVNAVLYRLHARFKHILIDEFQDTSPLQWHIIHRWLSAVHGGDDAPSVFIVGDAKQAIYRFRNGDSRLLEAAKQFLRDYYRAAPEENRDCRRCAPPLLRLVNATFAARMEGYAMHESVAGVNADLRGRVERHPPPPPLSRLRAPPRRRPRNPLAQALRDADAPRRLWAAAIARRLRAIIGRVMINAGGGARPCRAEDILVLLPQSTHMAALTDALARHGLPYVAGGGGGSFLHSFACDDILALAAVLLSPENDLSLAQVLKSPLFGFSEEQLADVVYAGDLASPLWTRLMNGKGGGEAAARARDCLRRWHARAQSGVLPAHDLLSGIFADGDVPARYRAAVPAAYQRRVAADLAALLDFSLANDAGRQPLLSRFLNAARRAAAEGGAPAEGGAGARVMTVHKAKGLEAPVVVIADTTFGAAHSGGRADSTDMLIDWPPQSGAPRRFVFRPRRFARAWADLAAEERRLGEREYDNLLYVAMTRARQMLLIFSAKAAKEESADGGISRIADLDGAVKTLAKSDADGVYSFGDDLPAAAADGDAATAAADAAAAEKTPVGAYKPNDAAARARGERLHRLAALLLQGLSDDEVAAVAADADAPLLAAAKRLIAAPPLPDLLRACRRFDCEAEVADGGRVYRLDLLILSDDTAWIIDYKSGGEPARHRAQMRQYQAVIARAHPDKRVRAAIVTAAGEFHEVSDMAAEGAAPA